MKKNAIILCLFLFPIFAFSQNINFSISGRSGYTLPQSQAYYQEYINLTSLSYLNDSMALENTGNHTYDLIASYKPRLTYELQANIEFPISESVSIQTGIGLNWLSFQRTSRFDDYEFTIIQQDTIFYNWNNPNNSILSCDRITNQELLNEQEDGERYNILNLTIPLSVKYHIGQTKFSVKAGVYMQTPIYSQIRNNYISTEIEETPTETICTYVLQKNEDNSGSRINELQLGCHAELEYFLKERFSASLNVAQNLSSLTQNQYFFTPVSSEDKFIPMRISAGLNVYLGKND